MKVQDVGCELQKHAQLNFSGCLQFHSETDGSSGVVYLDDGVLYAAMYDSFRGKHAVQYILRITSPVLDERYGETYDHKEITQPLDEVLVEAMQAEFAGTELPEPLPAPEKKLKGLTSSGPLDDGTSPYIFILSAGGKEWVLDTGRYMVGRNETCHVSIQDSSSVSSFHCVIDISASRVSVLDYHSTNGTFVNGSRVEDSVEMQPGETLSLGSFDLSLRTGLRARHGKRVIHAFSIDMITRARDKYDEPVRPQVPKIVPKKELSLPINDSAIRYKKADPSKGHTWTVPIPRFFSKK